MSFVIHHGDWIDELRKLPDESVQCVVTSPPYWGLRDYGVAGQLGLERTPEEYVAKIVEGFRELRRVLRSDGTCWVNLGDSYASTGGHSDKGCSDRRGAYNIGTRPEHEYRNFRARAGTDCDPKRGIAAVGQPIRITYGLKPKDLVGIPWMVAFALRDSGWYLRMDVIWEKRNPMPESVTDRPTKSHEYIFLLTKSARYFYDADAIKEETSGTAHSRGDGVNPKAKATGKNSRQLVDRDPAHLSASRPKHNESFSGAVNELVESRNKRSVWSVATNPFSEAHFATFPPKLIEPCILAGSSEKGCCSKCGSPWIRLTEKRATGKQYRLPAGMATHSGGHGSIHRDGREQEVTLYKVTCDVTVGWEPTCTCDSTETMPCIVLDPFNGAGTTGLVSTRLGRSYIGIELNQEYIAMAQRRIINDAPLFNGQQEPNV